MNNDPSAQASTPAAGWYPEPGSGQLRWWDGFAWGIYAHQYPAQFKPYDRGPWAIVSHLGSVIGGFILPLVIYLTVGKEDDFVRHHSKEALNFQLTWMIAIIASVMLLFITLFLTIDEQSQEPPWAIFALFPLIFVIQFVGIVMSIIGAVKAGGDGRWRYPVSIRFVKGR